ATIDLPPGEYRGIAASGDGTQIFVSQSSERKILKFTGDPSAGYAADPTFDLTLDPSDVGTNDLGTFRPTFLGLGFMDDPGLLFAATDSIFAPGSSEGAYPYGRIYVIDATSGASLDTIDVAQWNFDHAGVFDSGSSDGRWGGFTSTYDVDIEPSENAVYSQTYYGWQVEKWVFDGDLGTIVSVEQIVDTVPTTFDLKQNYPNPFNPSTTIEFDLRQTGHVTLSIYNLLGQKVATLVDEQLTPGSYKTTFDASRLTSGVYFYTLKAGSFRATKKMVLTK
ncbi:MAG: T9SS type A sorting domain-containing protein, partial [bacterium]